MSEAVVGLSFGDEGKGIVTDFLCSQTRNPLVIRYSGGQQAGHTVCCNGKKHTFSNFGSGTLRGAPTFWSRYCTIDPVGIKNEYKKLIDLGIEPTMVIDPMCPVTTTYDKLFNRVDHNYLKHGSCGVGVGQTWQREEDHYHLSYKDLFCPSARDIKLDLIGEYYKNIFKEREDWQNIYNEFMDACHFVTQRFKAETIKPSMHWDIIFEGSQGLLLDQDIGFFPHVTRSNTGSKNIDPSVFCLVTRAYQTRHGNGPMTNDNPLNIDPGSDENNKKNEYQGRFRISTLDLDLLKYAIESDEKINNSKRRILFITCLDHVVNKWRFTRNGKLQIFHNEDDFVEGIQNILKVEKILRIRSPRTEDIVMPYGIL